MVHVISTQLLDSVLINARSPVNNSVNAEGMTDCWLLLLWIAMHHTELKYNGIRHCCTAGTHVHKLNRVLTTLENLENLEISGNLLILENSGNLKFTQGIYMILSLGHRVMCIIVSNSSVHWLGDTVTGVDRASHHVPSIKYSVILRESCRTDC